jgi:hypothetical protein
MIREWGMGSREWGSDSNFLVPTPDSPFRVCAKPGNLANCIPGSSMESFMSLRRRPETIRRRHALRRRLSKGAEGFITESLDDARTLH